MAKFDRLMQNDLPMTINGSKSKQEAQFQYGGRPFTETGSSFILAMDIIRTAYYIRGLELMKLIFVVLDVSLTMGLTRCYKTEGFFYINYC